jgi:hypothetical protein
VDAILDRHATLAQLLDNEWIALTVMDPTQQNTFFHYQPGGTWAARTEAPASSDEELVEA